MQKVDMLQNNNTFKQIHIYILNRFKNNIPSSLLFSETYLIANPILIRK